MRTKVESRLSMGTPPNLPQPKDVCGVCGKPINHPGDAFAYSHPDTDARWRHKKCGPGSAVWVAKHGKSEIGSMLEKRKANGKVPGAAPAAPHRNQIVYKAIKELCARERYLRYMGSVGKNKFRWCLEVEIAGQKITQYDTDAPLDPEVLYNTIIEKSR